MDKPKMIDDQKPDINRLFKQYTAIQDSIRQGEGALPGKKAELSNLEKAVAEGKQALNETEKALREQVSEGITGRIGELADARSLLDQGKVKEAYAIVTGKVDHVIATTEKPDVAIRRSKYSIEAVSRIDGKTLWSRNSDRDWPVYAQDDRRVYVANGHDLISLDSNSGEVLKKSSSNYEYNDILQDKGVVYALSENFVTSYDAESFKRQWEEKLPLRCYNRLAKAGESLFVATCEGIFSLDARTGEENWQFSTKGMPVLDLAGDENDGSVYGLDYQGTLVKVDGKGNKVWGSQEKIPRSTKLTSAQDKVYVGSIDGIHAFESKSGKHVWTSSIIGFFPSSIEIVDDKLEATVHAVSMHHEKAYQVITLDPKTGEKV